MITLILPTPISANRYWISFYAAKLKRIMVAPTKEAKAYKEEVRWLAKAAGIGKPLSGRVAVEIDLYPHRPLDWQKRATKDPLYWDDTVQCIDLGNCEKVLSDALNGVAFVDDKQIHRLALRRMEPDERPARVVVRIEPIVARSPQPQIEATDGSVWLERRRDEAMLETLKAKPALQASDTEMPF